MAASGYFLGMIHALRIGMPYRIQGLSLPTGSDDIDRLFEELAARMKRGEPGADMAIVEAIALDAYKRPRLYGFSSEEDVGDAFARYWDRIVRLAERYDDSGRCFRAFAIASFRYMALSLRRQGVARRDREETFINEAKAELVAEDRPFERYRVPREGLRLEPCFPPKEESSFLAEAFRRRVLFICLKCAHVLDDGLASEIARASGLDEGELLSLLAEARRCGRRRYERRRARQRGREIAWLRMCARERRLARETEGPARVALRLKIDRDRDLYRRAVRHIESSSFSVPNTVVSGLLGVPKGTIDCGIVRVVRTLARAAERAGDE